MAEKGIAAALRIVSVCLAILALVDSATAGGDAENGETLARALCTSCHVVGREPPEGAVVADVPTFVAIANAPDQNSERIAGRIVIPHPQMPQIPLTRNEIADLATYIMTLKGE